MLAFHPRGKQLALCYHGTATCAARIFDVEARRAVAEVPGSGRTWYLAWHPDGRRLALGSTDARAYVFDVPSRRFVATMEGHGQDVHRVEFHPDGDLLATTSWDGTSRLWNAAGRSVLTRAGSYANFDFSADGAILGYILDGNQVTLMEVAPGLEYRTYASTLRNIQEVYRGMDISPDGRLLAVGVADGLRLWDLASDREIAHVSQGITHTVFFQPDGSELITCGGAVLKRWPIHRDDDSSAVLLGPPSSISVPGVPLTASRSANGRKLAVACEQSGLAAYIDLDDREPRNAVLPHVNVNRADISPDGLWIVIAGWHSQEIKVWNTRTLKAENQLPPTGGTQSFFSPDGTMLVNCRQEEFCFYDVPSWKQVRAVKRTQSGHPSPAAFAPDGRTVALELSPGIIHLVEWPAARPWRNWKARTATARPAFASRRMAPDW
jgi:WD40 repeat protein